MKKSFAIAIFTALLGSGNFIAAKFTTYDLGPLTSAFLRYTIASFFLATLMFIRRQNPLRIDKSDVLVFVLLGVFGFACHHYFFFISLKYTSVINTGIISATSPIITAILFKGKAIA